MSIYTLYLEPNTLNGLYSVDLVNKQVQLSQSKKEWLLKLIKSNPTGWVKGVGISDTIIYEDNGQLKTVLGSQGGSRSRRVRKSSRKSSNKRANKRSY